MRTVPSRVVDACVFHEWASSRDIAPYLEEGWRELVLRPGDPMGPANVRSTWLYPLNPRGAKAADAFPADGLAGSSRELLEQQLLGRDGRDCVVLGYDDGILSTVLPNYYAARAVAKAANDWTISEWLSRDDRLFGMILISSALPEDAAHEIRRAGKHERMVAVALGGNALGRSFGHPIYSPIYEAAVDMSLPLVLQVGSDAGADQITPPLAGGLPATHGEYRALGMHSHMSHVASLIIHGVFERFPTLRLLLIGGGAAWIPAWLWRLDYWYRSTQRELPWLRQQPTDYFCEAVRVGTYQLESPPQIERLATALRALPGIDRMLIYASCYPNSDAEEPDAMRARLPEAWHDRILCENGLEFFRWPSRVRSGSERRDEVRARQR